MLKPEVIEAASFQMAWGQAILQLKDRQWDRYNLVVHVRDVEAFDKGANDAVKSFCIDHGLKTPTKVARTIFPQRLYELSDSADDLYRQYLEVCAGAKGKLRWGTYFQRMIQYPTANGIVRQLPNVIDCLNKRQKRHHAAYTMLMQKPGSETVLTMGGPCLNYVAIQISGADTVGLLAVYRNHEFLERAYGNYWGLCNLTRFIAKETGMNPGPLTCISSHAYVRTLKRQLAGLGRTLS